jgi:carbamoyl-phosphate synthase large subunit
MHDLVRREKVDVVIPMSEAEIRRFGACNKELEWAPTHVLMANLKAIEVGSDKLLTARFIESIGLPAPWTMDAGDVSAGYQLPCIFKPRHGAGSRSVVVCNDTQEVDFYRTRIEDGILQELLLPQDREVTCALFRSRTGEFALLQLLRRLSGGFTCWARVIYNPEVYQQCEQLARALCLEGSINVQLRITAAGPRIFEINPRFSSTVLLRHRLGFSDLLWALQDWLGEPISLQSVAIGRVAARIQGAAVVPEFIGV